MLMLLLSKVQRFFIKCLKHVMLVFILPGLSKPKMPVAKFELPVAKYFYRLPPGGV